MIASSPLSKLTKYPSAFFSRRHSAWMRAVLKLAVPLDRSSFIWIKPWAARVIVCQTPRHTRSIHFERLA